MQKEVQVCQKSKFFPFPWSTQNFFFFYSLGFGNALLDFSQQVNANPNPPNVISLSLGSLSWASCNLLCTQAVNMGASTYSNCLSYVQSQFQVCMYTSADQVSRINNEVSKFNVKRILFLQNN